MSQWVKVSVLAATVLAGCSASLDFHECDTSADCPAGTVCSNEGFCVGATDLWLRQALTAPPCEVIWVPPESEPPTALIATLLPLTGPRAELGRAAVAGVFEAVDVFDEIPSGLGPSGLSVEVLACDSAWQPGATQPQPNVDAAKAALEFVDSTGIPVVIGPLDDALASAVRDTLELPGGPAAVAISPWARTAEAVASAGQPLRLWRVQPPYAALADGVRAVLQHAEQYFGDQRGPVGSDTRIFIMHHNDAGAGAIATALSVDPTLGAGMPASTGYGVQLEEAILALQAAAPQVVVLVGGAETADIVAWVEQHAPGLGIEPPRWVVVDLSMAGDFLGRLDAASGIDGADVARRLVGVTAGAPLPADDPARTQLAFEFGVDGARAVVALHAWDATWAALFALEAALRMQESWPPRPEALAEAMGRLSPQAARAGEPAPPKVLANAAGFGAWRAALEADPTGAAVDLDGLAGSLDFGRDGQPTAGPADWWQLDWPEHAVVRGTLLDRAGNYVAPGAP